MFCTRKRAKSSRNLTCVGGVISLTVHLKYFQEILKVGKLTYRRTFLCYMQILKYISFKPNAQTLPFIHTYFQ